MWHCAKNVCNCNYVLDVSNFTYHIFSFILSTKAVIMMKNEPTAIGDRIVSIFIITNRLMKCFDFGYLGRVEDNAIKFPPNIKEKLILKTI